VNADIGNGLLRVDLMDDLAQRRRQRSGIRCRAHHQVFGCIPGRNTVGLLPGGVDLRLTAGFQTSVADIAYFADDQAVVIANVDTATDTTLPVTVAAHE
jgi:hypothetical protein